MKNQVLSNRKDRRRQQTRRALIEAADSCFKDCGVENVTVKMITDKADVAYATFYNHFVSITDIVPAVAEYVLIKFSSDIELVLNDYVRKYDEFAYGESVGLLATYGLIHRDASIGWLVSRPELLADELLKVLDSIPRRRLNLAIEAGHISPVLSVDTILTSVWWTLVGVLKSEIDGRSDSGKNGRELVGFYMLMIGYSKAKTRKILSNLPPINEILAAVDRNK